MTHRRTRASAVLFFVAAAGLAVPAAAADPTPAATSAPKPAPTPGAGTSALVVDDSGGQTLLGMAVQTPKGEEIGHVVDVVVDRRGELLGVLIDFGGFLGVGSRKIAVDWRSLHLPASGALNKLIADLPRDQLRNAPVYKAGEPIVIMGAPAPPAPAASAAPAAPAPSPAASPSATSTP